MLWIVLLLLLSALGVLWWRFAMPPAAGAAAVPPPFKGNHPSLRTRHYRLADFYPVSLAVPEAPRPASQVPEAAPHPPPDSAAPRAGPDASSLAAAAAPPPAPGGHLPVGALHNYLSDPAPTATDQHNRGVELTAAERRAKMRSVMSAALENRRAAPATA